ncbi:UDP-N-acetyl-D-mannosamine dehydrogenase [Testudinibacter sp. TR-2022]|uniref:UDP-N-acetyl-D-mannosamine dehydrogenase n=1 Tax=Testudinibacter sp. TR-2022 TaxID=2585029 RepID=UPI001118F502|nr:UDP-N-acetyl-D-mannosamine dehydrogenase [Testudinibacter sp. TR-2022]TNH04547.1 UDP-N-acetyl-D-mannosamine dehydrogenase [Pasteurellaceae bacterium Phil31]TNH07804.1 UDP-N-acetyl-D-mannosamine dehydrogenase [Testudinibacter sp. TR-2022]TNH11226.1 UDP-N-acetyl-D-mannosamine dehydrogenase [Testudinibacter sp. TR-2022]TNH14468.1 UDP-N-acetyl-D-mannosamine dehydrogenase [Testudinibacter sp. TR-2022]TNH14759.1 UDP-N-acetyl-D-mannosamine dehydrogenase [Testudinibacter sp. TR-2022]
MSTEFNTISVIGLGYIGLPTATAFASSGKRVLGVDLNRYAVDTINQGKIHIVEPDLDVAVKSAVEQGLLTASTKVLPADAFLIAVPTPFKDHYQPDLSYVESASKSIAPVLQKGNLVVLESTSPVGATEQVEQWLMELRPDLSFPSQVGDQADIKLAYCPERVLPGKIMQELFSNDRVIGGLSPACAEQAARLYQLFVKGECIVTNARTAEMCKLTENSFRDVNIAFANELSLICDHLKISVWELIKLANRHPRVNILQPGAGVGGHCIAVDPWFIVAQSPEQARLIRTAREVNDYKPHWVIEQVKQALAEAVTQRDCKASEITIACLGLAFKPDIDDLRESPAVEITAELAQWHVGKVLAVEPNIEKLSAQLQQKVQLTELDQALTEADILVLLVDHKQFKAVAPQQIQQQWVIDTRGIWRS